MVEIRYHEEKPQVFEMLFPLHEYIPLIFFEISEGGAGAELYFFLDLFKKEGMMAPESSARLMIWSVHHDCFYKDIPFTMVHDKDYDLVSFAVAPENRAQIAEVIKELIEKQRILSGNAPQPNFSATYHPLSQDEQDL